MSCSTLKRKLKQENTSFSEVYLNARMNKATKLLRNSEYNITRVAYMCGYDSASYFTCVFKKTLQNYTIGIFSVLSPLVINMLMRYLTMQYKNKAKHINIRDGILLLAKKFDLTLSEKKVIYYVAAGLSVKSCSNLLDRNIKTISTQKRSAYKKWILLLMLN
ncbi:GerE family regulatory protein [Salmonella enterica subsp. enterica]|uniref:GerE family regulatory protein n=27 Tax=Salmonella enterica TaxID=28901 RepID=A0A3S4GQF8_SALET|nr:GerE family regulatory protein [Salmonella enterica subsp. enterica]